MRKVQIILAGIALLLLCGTALADQPITTWLLDPATPLAREVKDNFWYTMLLVLPFLLLPQLLLAMAIWKFRESRGHKAATFHENAKLEIAWTLIPALTLVLISVPAYQTLRKMDVPPASDLVVEVIGHQFFWEYRYPRYGVGFANEALVVPADKVVTLNCTSVDVIHSYWVPAFGIKQDANPGRISHTWFKARAGKYKGQCAELCGTLHGEMFINVTVMPQDQFDDWIKEKMAANQQPVAPQDTVGAKKTAALLEGASSDRSIN